MRDFWVGMAKKDITPELGTMLFGYPVERPAKKCLDKLYVNAMAIRQGEETILLLGGELCLLDNDMREVVTTEIALCNGLKKENIFCFTTHTHSGPITTTQAGWGATDKEYIEHIFIPRSKEAASAAITDLRPAVMGVGMAESLAGINRRQVTSEGEVILGQNSNGPYDPVMTVIVFRTPEEENIGSLIHFAAHPTSAGANLSISRDWPGYMIDRVEEITGAGCMYINGAEGDIGPRLSNGMTTGDDSYIKEIGLIAAADAEKAVSSITEFKVPELRVLTDTISLPCKKMPSLQSVVDEMEAMGDPEKLIEVDVMKYARLQKIKEMHESGTEAPDSLEIIQTVMSLDSVAFVPVPFEAFCEISLCLNVKSPYEKTLLMGLTGGNYGYLPTEDQMPYGGYEIDSFHAAMIPGFVESLDKNIVNENVRLLKRLFMQKRTDNTMLGGEE